jgi:hypothetical protein
MSKFPHPDHFRTPLLALAAAVLWLAAASPAAAQFKPPVHTGPDYGAMAQTYTGGLVLNDGGVGEPDASRSAAIDSGNDTYRAFAAASLGGGILKASSLSRRDEEPCPPPIPPAPTCEGVGSMAHAAMWDTIELFQLADDVPVVENTLIPLELSIDGVLDGDAQAKFRFFYGDRDALDLDNLAWFDLNEGVNFYNDIMLIPPVGRQFVYIELFTSSSAEGGANGFSQADFSHTLHFNWTLPDGIYAQSASGVFLSQTAAVPEPGAWALMIIGFGLSGAALRRQRALSAAA